MTDPATIALIIGVFSVVATGLVKVGMKIAKRVKRSSCCGAEIEMASASNDSDKEKE